MQALGGFALGLHIENTRQDSLPFKGHPIKPFLETTPYMSMKIPTREHPLGLFARMAGAGGQQGRADETRGRYDAIYGFNPTKVPNPPRDFGEAADL